ncbi:membrane-associated calcum-binding protein, related, putative [Eimeria praecox]|uniref:Membrane-associated calcum-binding protein, related, putative n=1 Tax=Eimeria praecox TaxID=51316 RepID=U6G6V3_9EIME|nr:membrane-associated calcum-binding protein, related, putative [Eimeria praecox]
MHKHQVKQEFLSIDKDNDGKITLEELEVTYTDGSDPASGSLSLDEVTILMDPGKDEVLMQIEVDEIMAVS